MAIEKKTIPAAPFKGLFLDGVTVPGGLSKAENVIILADGTAERRPFERTLADTEACMSSRGTKEVFELLKNSGTRYIFADIDNSETYTSAFGAEEVASFATWTATSGWTYGSSKWTHGSGTTALAATGGSETLAPVAAAKYHLVLDITCPVGSSGTGNWAFTDTDSGYTWKTKTGNTQTVWLRKWTHTAGATTPLTTANDFTPDIGGSYVVQVHVTHTSGTGLTVTMGGLTLGTVASTGTHTLTARFCTSTAALKFTPSSDWVGSINKTWPKYKALDNWCSVKKLLDPAGTTDASNWDYSEGTHYPPELYANGAELFYNNPNTWYPEVAATISQSVAITFGGTAVDTVTTSGIYEYDVTATNTTTLTFTPTTSWTGSINSASVKKLTQAAAATKTKVIGGEVTGTTDYEVTWGNILTDLTSGDTVHPCWTALQDRAFRVDGSNPNYWFEDSTYYHKLGCPAPADAPTTANTTGGGLLAGDYNVYYTYVKKYANNYVVEGNPSPASYVTVTDTAITCAVVASTEADITHIRIYRTLYGETGSYAYFDQEIKNITQTATLVASDDDVRDTLSTLEFDHDVPPIGKYVLGAGSRLWIIDNDGTLHWSILDQPELMPLQNYQTFDPKDGDVMMGLCPLRKHILVFKRRRTWLLDMFSETVDDNGVAALSKDVVSSNIGCIASGSIQAVGTDSAIWLSHAGFMLYNGGTIRNISGGDESTPSRIQNVINNFLADGAEHFIDSVYHSARQLYHVNFLTRNAAGTTITEQRHFVYNLQTDSWTEYVYRNSAGTKMYETNFAMAHDSLGNEVILIPYISSTTGTITYVYQGEYGNTTATTGTEIIDSAGDGATALNAPVYSFTDDDDNYYVITADDGEVFKITSAGVKSVIATSEQIVESVPGYIYKYSGDSASLTGISSKPVVDLTGGCFYIRWNIFLSGSTTSYAVYQISFDGTIALVENGVVGSEGGVAYLYMDLYADDNALFVVRDDADYTGDAIDAYHIDKFVNPGAGQVESVYYDLYDNGYTGAAERVKVYSDDLYVQYTDSATYDNLQIIKFTTITGAATPSLIDTGISATDYTFGEFLVVSDTEIIVAVTDRPAEDNTTIYKLTYSGGEWGSSVVVGEFAHTGAHGKNIGVSLDLTDSGEFVVGGIGDYIGIYNSDWVQVDELHATAVTQLCGTALKATDNTTCTTCGYSSDNAYELTSSAITVGDTEPEMKNTIAHIVSNYNDLGMSQDKRISRAYLDVDAKYPGCGSFSLEPSYEVNYYTHSYGESSQPSGSVSMRPWYHPGHQTWSYTNSAFDSDVEQWYPMRLDVGTRGNKFRYAIRAGDVAANVTGTMRIRPPRLEVQILGKSGKDD